MFDVKIKICPDYDAANGTVAFDPHGSWDVVAERVEDAWKGAVDSGEEVYVIEVGSDREVDVYAPDVQVTFVPDDAGWAEEGPAAVSCREAIELALGNLKAQPLTVAIRHGGLYWTWKVISVDPKGLRCTLSHKGAAGTFRRGRRRTG